MNDLLTAKQVQDLFRVDRTTIYRMLGDGRLHGVKVGNRWRFPREEIEGLLAGERRPRSYSSPSPEETLPIHCMRLILDVFADIAQIGSLIAAPDGIPLTPISNSCRYCSLLLDTETGRQACISSWRKLSTQSEGSPKFVECHAGLKYARARIEIDGELKAMVIAGQFSLSKPSQPEQDARVKLLADRHGIDAAELAVAARDISVLDDRKVRQIGTWMEKIASTFEYFARERLDLVTRLRRIADMSVLK